MPKKEELLKSTFDTSNTNGFRVQTTQTHQRFKFFFCILYQILYSVRRKFEHLCTKNL